MEKPTSLWLGAASVIAVVAFSTACHDSVMVAPVISNLTISNADPADGNGTLDADTATVDYTSNYGFDDLDRVTLSVMDSARMVVHDIEIQWLPATAEVRLFQHFWAPVGGATSGAARCAAGTASVCNPSHVYVDPVARNINCDGVVLQGFQGYTATSTISGIVRWADDDPNGGEH